MNMKMLLGQTHSYKNKSPEDQLITTQPPTSLNEWTFGRVMRATLVLVLVALCFWLLYRFSQVIFMFLIALVLGTMLRPVVAWLNSRGIPRVRAGILVYGMLVALFAILAMLLFPLIVEQASTVAVTLPVYYYSLREWMAVHSSPVIVSLSELLPTTLPMLEMVEQAGEQMLASAGQVMGYLAWAGGVVFALVLTLLLAFHWTMDGARTIRSLLLLVPKDRREDLSELIAGIEAKVGAYLVGQAVLCLVIGAISLVVYQLIGLPNALVLAIIAGVLEAVPMLGPVLGAVPAVMIGMSISPASAMWVVAASIVIQQAENSYLMPLIMRKTVAVNPFVSLLAIFAFTSLFGIPGALIAVPFAAILQLLLDRYVFNSSSSEAEVSAGRDYISLLHYETLDLARDLRKQSRLLDGTTPQLKQHDRILDEIESIATDLDTLLAQVNTADTP